MEDMRITVIYDVMTRQEVLVEEGSDIYAYVTEEEYGRIVESYKSGKFEKMYQDKDLSDILEKFNDRVNEMPVYDYDCPAGMIMADFAQYVSYLFEYPEEVKQGRKFGDSIDWSEIKASDTPLSTFIGI